jgi:peptidoglycan/LPS O-acetylase OafA/YrhL
MIALATPNSALPKSSRRLAVLDGLRAISISLVLLGHVSGTRGFPDLNLSPYVGDYANLGVIVFFVISGYLITTLLLEEHQRFRRISLSLFYARRFLRLMPALFAFIGCILVLEKMGLIQLMRRDLLAAITYTVNFRSDTSYHLGHLWSLSVEEQFYFLWPAVLVISGTRRAGYAAAGMLVLSPISRLWALHHNLPSSIFPSVADSLACGCLLAIWGESLGSRKWYRSLLAHSWFMPAAVVVVFFCNAMRVFQIGATLGVTAINLLCAVAIHRCMLVKSPLTTFFSLRPMVLIGELSYSLYLWQQLFLNRHSAWAVCGFPLNLFLALLAASASYFVIERPLNQLRRKLHPKRLHSSAAFAAEASGGG